MRSSRICWVVACAGILLAGCDDGPPAEAPTTAATAAKPTKPAAALVPPEMVAAVSSSRNAGVVGVHFVLNGIPTVNQALPIDIVIVPHEAMASVTAHFEARDGLALATGNVLERQVDPAPEKIIKHQLVLLPGKEGVYMVTAVVETQTGDGEVSRIYSIPIIVGPPGAVPAKTPPAPPPVPPASG